MHLNFLLNIFYQILILVLINFSAKGKSLMSKVIFGLNLLSPFGTIILPSPSIKPAKKEQNNGL